MFYEAKLMEIAGVERNNKNVISTLISAGNSQQKKKIRAIVTKNESRGREVNLLPPLAFKRKSISGITNGLIPHRLKDN